MDRVITSDNEWQRVAQRVTTSGTTNDNKLTTSGGTNDNEWHWKIMSGKTNDSK